MYDDEDRLDKVHKAVKRLVRRPDEVERVLDFYHRSHIHSELEDYILNEIKHHQNWTDSSK